LVKKKKPPLLTSRVEIIASIIEKESASNS